MAERRRRAVVAAAAGVVVGIVAAGALWIAAGVRRDAAVEGLARAPVGCETSLTFAEPGQYLLYLETSGELDELPGDCAAERTYERTSGAPPTLDVELRDDAGSTVAVEPSGASSYDAAGYGGAQIATATIGAAGDYVLTVRSTEDDFVLAIGKDPGDGVGVLRTAAVACLLVGLIVGGILLVVAARRDRTTVPEGSVAEAPVPPPWPDVSSPPISRSQIHGEPLYTGEPLRPPPGRSPWAPPPPPPPPHRDDTAVGSDDGEWRGEVQ